MNNLYKKSKWLHKYLGLFLLLFLIWMSISGILLNHPDSIKDYSVSKSFVPSSYHPNNWNRSTMKNIVYSDTNDSLLYVYGRQGVYVSKDSGKTFSSFMSGDYPKSAKGRRTNYLYSSDSLLLAATNAGLFQFDYIKSLWKRSVLSIDEEIIKILKTKKELLVFTHSNIYSTNKGAVDDFIKLSPQKDTKENHIRLVDFFIEVHDGSIFGFAGKIIWDISGLILIFLSVSAFYIWFYPRKWKSKFKNKKDKSKREVIRFKFLFKYHKKLGWYAGILLLLIVFTGMFLRPPLIIALAGKTVSDKNYLFSDQENVWKNNIDNALYDSQNDRLILACKNGLWEGKFNDTLSFKQIYIPVNIFAMGVTVFDEYKPGQWIIGSFAGLSMYNLNNNEAFSLMEGNISESEGRPAPTMVTGCVVKSDSILFAISHYKGLCDLNGHKQTEIYHMPDFIRDNYRMPLWNYLFEIHNARIFRSFIGGIYILIIPLFGLLSIIILISGFIDYLHTRLKK
ncbi:MAG: PepSY-associated TM helix domain-containing protein [Marinifilaceae bacterium]